MMNGKLGYRTRIFGAIAIVTLLVTLLGASTASANGHPLRILNESEHSITLELEIPAPEIAKSEEFASAAAHIDISYPQLLQKIVNLGLRRGK